MNNVYEWFDPIERIARLKREKEYAFRDGQQDILNMIAGYKKEIFDDCIRYQTEEFARKIVYDRIGPYMKDAYMVTLIERVTEDVVRLTNPAVSGIVKRGKLELVMKEGINPMDAMVSYQYSVMKPFRIAHTMDLRRMF